MALIFKVDYRKGNTTEMVKNISGTLGLKTRFGRSEYGYAKLRTPLDAGITYVTEQYNLIKSTLIIWCTIDSETPSDRHTFIRLGSEQLFRQVLGLNPYVYEGYINAIIRPGTIDLSTVAKNKKAFQFVFHYDGSQVWYSANAGEVIGTKTNMSDPLSFKNIVVGNSQTERFTNGKIFKVELHDDVVSDAYLAQDYKEMLTLGLLSQPKTNFYYPKPNQAKDKKIGKNIILNPEFQGSSNWGTLGTVEFEDGKASVVRRSNKPNSTLNQSTLTVGKKYLARIYIDSDNTGNSKRFVNASDGGPSEIISTTTDDGRTFESSSTVGWCEFTFIAEKNTVGVCIPYTTVATGKIDITKFYVIELTDKPEIQYNMTNAKGKLLNLANNSLHGAISSGVVQTPEGLKFDGVNSSVEISAGVLSGINSIQFRMKPNKITREAIFSGIFSSNIIFIDAAGLVGAGSKSQVGNASNTAIKGGVWVNVQMVKHDIDTYSIWFDGVDVSGGSSTGYRGTTFTTIGRCSPNLPFSGELADVRMYAEKLTDQDAKDYHNQFSTQALLIDGFKFEPTNTGQNVVPKGWTRLAGGFKIDTDAVGDTVLIPKSGGAEIYIKLDSLTTYTVEFDIDWSSGYFYLYLLNQPNITKGSGYVLVTGNRIMQFKMAAGSATSISSTDTLAVAPQSVKFTRDFFGKMTMYLKNANGEYVLVPVTSGSNPLIDNTYSNFPYLVVSVASSSKFKNLRIYKGVKV